MTVGDFATVVQAFGTIFIAATFFVYWYQLRAMKGQLEATKQQLEANKQQIAENTRTHQTSQYQAALQLMFDWRSEIISHPKLVEHLKEEKYFQEVFSILPQESYFHTLKLFHIFEFYWLLHDRKVIDAQMYAGWSRNVAVLVKPPKNRALWAKLKEIEIFHPGFVLFVDQLIEANNRQQMPGDGST